MPFTSSCRQSVLGCFYFGANSGVTKIVEIPVEISQDLQDDASGSADENLMEGGAPRCCCPQLSSAIQLSEFSELTLSPPDVKAPFTLPPCNSSSSSSPIWPTTSTWGSGPFVLVGFTGALLPNASYPSAFGAASSQPLFLAPPPAPLRESNLATGSQLCLAVAQNLADLRWVALGDFGQSLNAALICFN